MLKKPSVLDWIALIIIVIGGLNWGLYGLYQLNIISMIFGGFSMIARVVYIIVGIAAIYAIVRALLCHKKCASECSTTSGN